MKVKLYTLIAIRGRTDGLVNTLEQWPSTRWVHVDRAHPGTEVFACCVFETEGEMDLFEELLSVLWDQDVLLQRPVTCNIVE